MNLPYKDYILIIKHTLEEGPGIIEEVFQKNCVNYIIVEFERGEKLPKELENIKGVISLGGDMNVYEKDKYPFLTEEELFINKIKSYNIPYLGICLGSQLLAKTFGAKVYVGKCKEVGFYEVEITDLGRKDNLFNCIEESFYVFQYHSDCFEIPEKGTLLVKGKDCYINQGFKVDENLYGLQFHIEVEEKLLRNFGIDYDGKLKVLKNTGEKIIKNFLNISFKN